MEKTFRFILSPKLSAKENMAIDKVLIDNFTKGDMPIFRLYTWEKSFTLGVSQKIEEYLSLKEKYEDNYSKRITGGGVLFHGHDLSYSLLLPDDDFKNLSVKQSYEKICQFLLYFYKNLGLNVCFAKDDENILLSKSPYCQVGFEAYDILVNGKKIGGNAQKRKKHLIFQHGSIPIEKIEQNEMIGNTLRDFGIKISYNEAIEKVKMAFENSFNIRLETSDLTKKEKEEIGKICQH